MASIARGPWSRASLSVLVLAMVLLPPATPAHADEEFSGSLPNGTQWIAAVPDDWNGILLLHSHGYTPSFVPFPNPAPSIDPQQSSGRRLCVRVGHAAWCHQVGQGRPARATSTACVSTMPSDALLAPS